MGERNKRTKLKKSMGPGSIWAVAVGSIIGWGCFIQGGLWTERAGGPLPLFLGFLAGGLLMIVVGYSYSYMIAKFPVAGGEFAYAYKGFGRTAKSTVQPISSPVASGSSSISPSRYDSIRASISAEIFCPFSLRTLIPLSLNGLWLAEIMIPQSKSSVRTT